MSVIPLMPKIRTNDGPHPIGRRQSARTSKMIKHVKCSAGDGETHAAFEERLVFSRSSFCDYNLATEGGTAWGGLSTHFYSNERPLMQLP